METTKGRLRVGGEMLDTEVNLGTFVRFKRLMGYDHLKEPHRLDSEGMGALALAAVQQAKARKGETYERDFLDFCGDIDPNDLMRWVNAQSEGEAEPDTEEKKTP